jgi:chromate transporter
MAAKADDETAAAPSPSLAALFLVCLKIGTLSFGGGLSGWLHREFVRRHGWINEEDFASSLAFAQLLPGANVVNLVICMGHQLRGGAGAAVGVFGFLAGPFLAVIALSTGFDRLPDVLLLERLLQGVAFAAIGLLLLICLGGVRRARRFPASLLVIVVTATCVGILRWPLILVVLVVAPLSVALAWRRA